MNSKRKPTIALAMGDPAGISPELTAKVVTLKEVRDAARVVVVGDRRIYDGGARVADAATSPDEFIDLKHADPAGIQRGVAAKAGGESALANYRTALRMVADGKADAVCFTPFNKQAMRMAEPSYDDEILFTSNVLGFKGLATEFNVLEGLWNARVTSHIPLKDVSAHLSVDKILAALEITAAALRAAGFNPPRIGVAALNPHAGDGGNFGREEIDIIEPAVRKAKAQGLPADGPYPADTVFVRAKAGQFDAVLTMYHDQGQIAMKLLGFDRGVTLLGGYPFPICTPAHGTAYDIAGKGVANVGAARAALLLAAKMAQTRSAQV
ncbi:MAG TPA: 4-hydroxythreonine-4-phosphate dehydrogenase PdxA [Burkholderiales bacterium]|nr:4-hydroxythreonine-4-phosphate dehydrogenase PdxA [Burkholderiales bacterium]